MDGKQYPVDEWLSGDPDLTFRLRYEDWTCEELL
jgi:hypothetical protein